MKKIVFFWQPSYLPTLSFYHLFCTIYQKFHFFLKIRLPKIIWDFLQTRQTSKKCSTMKKLQIVKFQRSIHNTRKLRRNVAKKSEKLQKLNWSGATFSQSRRIASKHSARKPIVARLGFNATESDFQNRL